jgi:sphingolipid 4-desaturase/C4-monooxygenase
VKRCIGSSYNFRYLSGMKRTDFVYSNDPHRHHTRARLILQEHPEIRPFIGKNRNSIWIIAGLVAFQLVGAALLAHQPWWLIVLLAFGVGAFADHALFVMIHECTHGLIFKGRIPNRVAGLLANVPLVFPSSVGFERYHLKHHSHLGIHDMDADLPYKWEAKFINNIFIGKAIWLALFPLVQLLRIYRIKAVRAVDEWTLLNLGIQIIVTFAIWWFLGPKALAFIALSFFFSIGLHPLGARWIQEHYLVKSQEQETTSYYGVLNTVAFNMGYHNEHHDFPSVPWNRLPHVKASAPAFYNGLYAHRSWTLLWLRFLFDREISLFSRIVHRVKGKQPEPIPSSDY